MSAYFHAHPIGALGFSPSYSFVDLPEIHIQAPVAYERARFEMQAREHRLGAGYYQHNAGLAHDWYMRKRSWWNF